MNMITTGETTYEVVPISRRAAASFVDEHHSYKFSIRAYKFALGIEANGVLVGVAVCGSTGARNTDNDLRTIEIRRLCVVDGHADIYSRLTEACRHAAKALGYSKIVAYTENDEPDTALKRSGFETTKTIQRRLRGGMLTSPPPDGHQLRLIGPADTRSDDHSGEKIEATRWECDLTSHCLMLRKQA